MCRVIRCRTCNRPTWAGCGAHVEQVLAHVPSAERCQCPREHGGMVNMLRSLFKGK